MKIETMRNKVLGMVTAATVAGMMAAMPAVAFADNGITSDGAVTGTHVTGAATRAAMPALEILGVDSVEESGQFVTLVNNVPQYNWTQPKYQLVASQYSAQVSPYLYNLANGIDNTTHQAAVYNASRAGGGAGPDSALAAYGTDTTDDKVWDLLPDIILGDGSGVDYSTYKPSVSGYSPVGLNYSFTNNSDIVDLMYQVAAAVDATGENGRFGNAGAIARDYEGYVKGIQGYVLQQIAAGNVNRAVVASISAYDADTQLYTLRVSGVSEGTASTNRYLEACENVAYNLANDYDADDDGYIKVDADVLAEADLILVGGQSSDTTTQDTIRGALDVDGIDNVYYVEDNGSAGAQYGVIMNSVENAQNVGRILGCLYSDVLDQDALVGYYYSHFYHIANANLDTVVANAMDGVFNLDGEPDADGNKTNWGLGEINLTDVNAVGNQITAGMTYLKTLGTSAPTALQLSSYTQW